jgi:hypothetical protein
VDHFDPQTVRLAAGVLAMAVMLAVTVLAMLAADRFLGPKDPRRPIVSRVILWIGTALLIAILLLIRRE